MTRRTTRSLAFKSAELALAAPQVFAHRMARMAMSGPTPSERDRKEFQRMVAEKNTVFFESWSAMAWQAALANQALMGSMFKSFLSGRGLPTAAASAAELQRAALGVFSKGFAPVHRKAVANAKRLGRAKIR
jgi:hypothetical protein